MEFSSKRRLATPRLHEKIQTGDLQGNGNQRQSRNRRPKKNPLVQVKVLKVDISGKTADDPGYPP